MTLITLPFGGRPMGFEVPAPNLAEILSPRPSRPLEKLPAVIEEALQRPIGQEPLERRVKPGDRVLIISDDITRLTPSNRLIPPLLARLNRAGVPDRRIACIMALGTHRYMTEAEMIAKVGEAVFRRIYVFNHA